MHLLILFSGKCHETNFIKKSSFSFFSISRLCITVEPPNSHTPNSHTYPILESIPTMPNPLSTQIVTRTQIATHTKKSHNSMA